MQLSDCIGVIGIVVGVIGIIVGIVGWKSLAASKEIKSKTISNSTINQADTLIVQNGTDTYAIFKIAKEVTQEELKGIATELEATTLDIAKLKSELEAMPRIYSGTEPPDNVKDGDIYLQYL